MRTHAIPERLRGVFTTRRYTNPTLPLSLPITFHNVLAVTNVVRPVSIYFDWSMAGSAMTENCLASLAIDDSRAALSTTAAAKMMKLVLDQLLSAPPSKRLYGIKQAAREL